MSSARPDLERLVRQHAATSALLGVGFVPCYRTGGAPGAAIEAKPDAASARITLPPVEPAAESPPGSAPAGGAGPSDRGSAEQLDALRERYLSDAPHAGFVTSFTNVVFGEGDPSARLMFVGEAPGADEDRTGRPFVGRAGQLLDKMIGAMGLSRETVYIANVLKTRPPDNRAPSLEEARACAPYLFEQIRIVAPEVIVTLGRSASQLLLGTEESMGRLRGHWSAFPPPNPLVPVEALGGGVVGGVIGPIAVMPTYHPAFLLRQYTDDNRARVWSDLKQVMDRLGLPGRS